MKERSPTSGRHSSLWRVQYKGHCAHCLLLQAVISVFLAAGFSVVLGWTKAGAVAGEGERAEGDWQLLDPI